MMFLPEVLRSQLRKRGLHKAAPRDRRGNSGCTQARGPHSPGAHGPPGPSDEARPHNHRAGLGSCCESSLALLDPTDSNAVL